MFREQLFEKKRIKKKTIWEMRQSKELDFPESASILTELCTFDVSSDSFVYTSTEQHPNPWFKFSHNANLNAKELLNAGFNHQTQIKPTSVFQQHLFVELFGGLNLLEKVKLKWEQTLRVCEEDGKKRQVFQSCDVGCMYLMCLMINHKMGGGTDKGLADELQKVRVDEGERKKYEVVAKLSNIKQLLGIGDNPEEKRTEKKAVVSKKN